MFWEDHCKCLTEGGTASDNSNNYDKNDDNGRGAVAKVVVMIMTTMNYE